MQAVEHLLDLDIEQDRAGRLRRELVRAPEVMFAMTAGMRVLERRGAAPAEVVSTGEEQITMMIDGERLVFHLVEADEDGSPRHRLAMPRLIE